MTIEKQQNGNQLILKLSGRLDTITAPELEAELRAGLDDVSDLTFDLVDLEYVSSAGLRTLLIAQKAMNAKQGEMRIIDPTEDVYEIFDITGFTDIFTIEQ